MFCSFYIECCVIVLNFNFEGCRRRVSKRRRRDGEGWSKDEGIIENWDINFEELTPNDVDQMELRNPKVISEVIIVNLIN